MTTSIDTILSRLEKAEQEMTPGKWRAGRMDTESYDACSDDPFKSVYITDDRGGYHHVTGQKLPYEVARGTGDECRYNAAGIALLRNCAKELIVCARALKKATEDCVFIDAATGQRLMGIEQEAEAALAALAAVGGAS